MDNPSHAQRMQQKERHLMAELTAQVTAGLHPVQTVQQDEPELMTFPEAVVGIVTTTDMEQEAIRVFLKTLT